MELQNGTINNGTCEPRIPEMLNQDYNEISYLALALLVGGPLNLSACTRLRERRRHHGTNRLLLLKFHLNLSDLFVLFIFVTSRLCWMLTYDWRGGAILCPLILYFQALSFIISSNIVVCIALDRLLTLLIPRNHTGQKAHNRVRIGIICAWTLAIVSSIPQLVVWRAFRPYARFDEPQLNRFTQCITIWQVRRFYEFCPNMIIPDKSRSPPEDPEHWIMLMEMLEKIHLGAHIALSFWIPALIIVFCYGYILVWVCCHLREGELGYSRSQINIDEIGTTDGNNRTRQRGSSGLSSPRMPARNASNMRNSLAGPSRNLSLVDDDKVAHAHRFSSRVSAQLPAVLRAKRKILRSTLLIVLSYIACWLPYNVLSIIMMINYKKYRGEVVEHSFFVFSLVVFNSVLNPCLYGGVISFTALYDNIVRHLSAFPLCENICNKLRHRTEKTPPVPAIKVHAEEDNGHYPRTSSASSSQHANS